MRARRNLRRGQEPEHQWCFGRHPPPAAADSTAACAGAPGDTFLLEPHWPASALTGSSCQSTTKPAAGAGGPPMSWCGVRQAGENSARSSPPLRGSNSELPLGKSGIGSDVGGHVLSSTSAAEARLPSQGDGRPWRNLLIACTVPDALFWQGASVEPLEVGVSVWSLLRDRGCDDRFLLIGDVSGEDKRPRGGKERSTKSWCRG